MDEQTWTFVDKSNWGEGEWRHEPDRVYWIDPITNYPCLIRRNDLGNLCGYVAVEEGHPLFEQNFNDIGVEVHGGLTYSSFCQPEVENGICHIPEPGKPDHVWWLGFDCAHFGDFVPGYTLLRREFHVTAFTQPSDVYRNIAYVKQQCSLLALQLAATEQSKSATCCEQIADVNPTEI